MWSLISRLFSTSKRRAVRSYSGTTGVLEARQLLSATASAPVSVTSLNQYPQLYINIDGLHGVGNQLPVLIIHSTAKGAEVGTFRIYDWTNTGSPIQINLTGKNAQAFTVREISSTGVLHVFSIQVANSRLARHRAKFDLAVNAQTAPGNVSTQRLNILNPSEQTITVNENPTDGQLLGRLPARLRAARMQYSVVGYSNWQDTYAQPIRVQSGGRIVAHQFPLNEVIVVDDTAVATVKTQAIGITKSVTESLTGGVTPNFAFGPPTNPFLFNYESIAQTPGNPPKDGVIHSGDVLIAVYDPLLKTTEHVLVHVQLRNVDETPTIVNQSIVVGLDGTVGQISFNDPDLLLGRTPGDVSFSGPTEMKIVGGDSEGLFTITSEKVEWGLYQAYPVKLAKPELLNGRDTFTLQVQLFENGKLAGEATVTVKVLPTVPWWYYSHPLISVNY